MLELLFFTGSCLVGLALCGLYALALLHLPPKRTVEFMTRRREKFKENKEFSSLFERNAKNISGLKATEAQCYLSVVIPAMNEEERLPVMLDECLVYLQNRQHKDKSFTYEVILVDDGSRDSTSEVAYGYKKNYNVNVLKLEQNVGKGGAVRNGVLCAQGEFILFADADGATTFEDIAKLEQKAKDLKEKLEDSNLVVVGSRAHLEEESKATRSALRTFLMLGFHCLVKLFAVRTVRDTQCGFKLFSRKSASILFPRLHVERWAFDVELLYIAEQLNIPIAEVAVKWQEIDGSKLTPLHASIEMGKDILLLWFRYTSRIWRLQEV